jgi:hypothetical protein
MFCSTTVRVEKAEYSGGADFLYDRSKQGANGRSQRHEGFTKALREISCLAFEMPGSSPTLLHYL